MSPSDSDSETESSLYNPPEEEGEAVDPEATEDHEVLQLDIPKDLARHLYEESVTKETPTYDRGIIAQQSMIEAMKLWSEYSTETE